MKQINIGVNEAGQRFDRFLLKYFNNSTRSNIYKLIRKKVFKINGAREGEEYFLKEGDLISVYLSEDAFNALIKEEEKIAAEDVDLNIVYEDDEILIVDKPKGLLTHPDKTEYKDTLSTQVGLYLRHLSTRTFKPASIQRLDKNTSGLVIFCKTYDSLKKYNELMRERKIDKYYLAMVEGDVKEAGVVKGLMTRDEASNISRFDAEDEGAKESVTHYTPLRRFGRYTLLEVKLLTGRTHQIRLAMSSIGHPLVGDIKYGGKKIKNVNSQLLHGYKLIVNDKSYTSASQEIEAFIRTIE